MSDSVRPHRRQPTRLCRPWDFPGKNTGVGCHFLLLFMKMKSESEVTESCPTLSDPMDCSLPGSSIHGIFQSTGVGCHCLLHLGELQPHKFLLYLKTLELRSSQTHMILQISRSCQEPGRLPYAYLFSYYHFFILFLLFLIGG